MILHFGKKTMIVGKKMKKIMIGILSVFFLSIYPQKSRAASDATIENFEKLSSSSLRYYWQIAGFSASRSKDRSAFLKISSRASHSGKKGLLFSYRRGFKKGGAILQHFGIMRNFRSISFWIRSKRRASWVISIRDRKGHPFHVRFLLKAGRWTFVRLTPKDFRPSRKGFSRRLNSKELDVGFKAFDQFLLSSKGRNFIFIDDLRIQRGDILIWKGDFLLRGQKKVFKRSLRIEGNLILVGGATLRIENALFEVRGNIAVSSSTLKMKNVLFVQRQKYEKHRKVGVLQGGLLLLKDVFIHEHFSLRWTVETAAKLFLEGVRARRPWLEIHLMKGATLKARRCRLIAQFVLDIGARAYFSELSHFGLTLAIAPKMVVDLSWLDDKYRRIWVAPASLKVDVVIKKSRGIRWSFFLRRGGSLTLRHSSVESIVFIIEKKGKTRLSHLRYRPYHKDTRYRLAGRRLHLFKSRFRSWKILVKGKAYLTLTNSRLHVVEARGESLLDMRDVVCLGRPMSLLFGFQAMARVRRCRFEGDVMGGARSRVSIERSVIEGDVWVVDRAKLHLGKTTLKGHAHRQERGLLLIR